MTAAVGSSRTPSCDSQLRMMPPRQKKYKYHGWTEEPETDSESEHGDSSGSGSDMDLGSDVEPGMQLDGVQQAPLCVPRSPHALKALSVVAAMLADGDTFEGEDVCVELGMKSKEGATPSGALSSSASSPAPVAPKRRRAKKQLWTYEEVDVVDAEEEMKVLRENMKGMKGQRELLSLMKTAHELDGRRWRDRD